MKKLVAFIMACSFAISLASCSSDKKKSDELSFDAIDTNNMDFEFTQRDKDGTYEESTATSVTLSDSGISVKGKGAEAVGNCVTVSDAGVYVISGSATDISITVEAKDTDKIQIILNGATIGNSTGCPFYIKEADKVFLTLAQGSENTVSDGSDYTQTDAGSEIDGAIFSKADLTVNGSGILNVLGNNKHGIVSKDDLVIAGGELLVISKNVGICGKDAVKITDCKITVSAGSDAIRSDNEEDSSCGYVYVESGELQLSAMNDGIQAVTLVNISGGTVSVKTSGSALDSSKGIKSDGDITVSGGVITVSSADDALHAGSVITLGGGKLTLTSDDDGVHADSALSIKGADVTVTKSYEGLEASEIEISAGKISVVASDDGINAAGGNDSSSQGGRPGQNNFTSSSGKIIISGGYLLINSSGDGVDSNGTLHVSGGTVLVSGPTNSGNGALDYDGTATVTGGVFIALGAAGMAMNFSEAENQASILTSISAVSSGTNVAITDESGVCLAAFTPGKAYNSVMITAPGINKGNMYNLIIGGVPENADENGYTSNGKISGGTSYSITVSSMIHGSGSGMGGGFGGGGRPGRPW